MNWSNKNPISWTAAPPCTLYLGELHFFPLVIHVKSLQMSIFHRYTNPPQSAFFIAKLPEISIFIGKIHGKSLHFSWASPASRPPAISKQLFFAGLFPRPRPVINKGHVPPGKAAVAIHVQAVKQGLEAPRRVARARGIRKTQVIYHLVI